MKLLHALTLVTALLISTYMPELSAAGAAPTPPEEQPVRYRLVAVPWVEASQPTQTREPRPFSQPTHTQVIDKDGNEILRAPEGRTIAGIKMSPNRQWLLLYFGDAEYAVASIDRRKDIVRPPVRPDAPADATGFSWNILDDDRLIGQADLPSLEPTEGLTAAEVEGLPPRGTLVYLYTIATGAMTSVEIDDSVPQPFSITDDSYGNLTLVPDSGLYALGIKILRIPPP